MRDDTTADSPQGTERYPHWRRTRMAPAIAALLVCAGLVIGIGVLLDRQIEAFSTANSDNLQWTLAQTEVEYLRFRLSLAEAQRDPEPGALARVRRSFDIFYSRLNTLSEAEAFRALRDVPDYEGPRTRVFEFLDGAVPLIDGSDERLRAGLDELKQDALAAQEPLRALTLEGLSAFAEVADDRRTELVRVLGLLGLVLAALFAGLVFLAVFLYRLVNLAEDRERDVTRGAVRTRAIVETSLDGIFVLDGEGMIEEVNMAGRAIFGLGPEEGIGLQITSLFPPEAQEALRDGPFGFLTGDAARSVPPQSRRFESPARDMVGRTFPAEISVGRADTEGAPVHIAYIRDISRRKAAEQGLTEARDRALAGERAKAEFLAVMSHEMRTPLNGLLGSMQLMRDHATTERQSELLDRMQSSGRMLLGLVNDVLDLSKYEAGKMEAERRPLSVERLLDGVVETIAPLAAANGDTLAWEWIGPPHDGCTGDARRLRQVLLNLAGNAVKFTRGGEVTIEVEALGDGDMVEFRVIDTGIGIAEEDVERIFLDFETLDSSYARAAGGTGLGLGIARRLARLMGGDIGAESEPGEGSLFWLRVPLLCGDADAAGEHADAAGPARPASPLDLLLVEDNPINRAVAREMLEADGHKVTEAEDGRAGVHRAATRRFDAILMDVSMPVMDGLEAARVIRDGAGPCRDVPILAVTAHALPEEIAGFHAAGMTDVVNKPIDRDVLARTLAAAIGTGPDVGPAVPRTDRTDPLVDEAHLQSVWTDLPEGAREGLLARAMEEIDATVAAVAASDGPDQAALREDVHRAAGSCATLGLRALHRALADIETALKRGEPLDPLQRAELSTLWAGTSTALARWRDGA
ncbi:hybrid sensor histidine kinase/response regulator [Roseivivax sediminis]|uniref:histidine kinase n=1 Tax=Roseivivax sediminis TaxID=936889 RepID=A0A1I1X2K3_9RHOB|nr:ATP-binding protein [Roseivivax sediminis]SFE00838.1 PAS domain S-box-containing protein [Roseivivax sediminis]